jgi:hypothetical protein
MRFKSGRYTGVSRYLLNERGYRMSSSELRRYLDLPDRLPADLEAEIVRGGLTFHVYPKRKRGMEKRLFVNCPECEQEIEAGHLHQHVEARHG